MIFGRVYSVGEDSAEVKECFACNSIAGRNKRLFYGKLEGRGEIFGTCDDQVLLGGGGKRGIVWKPS